MWSRVGGLLGRGVVVALGLTLAAVLVWLRPFGADARALDALQAATDAGTVTDATTWLELQPVGEPSGVGLVFQPGARVDARAYVALLEPYAEAGHLVVVVKQPFGIGFAATGAPDRVVADHPEIGSWVVGGHSLGGVAASSWAAGSTRAEGGSTDGLLLWASYPLGDLSGTDLQVVSVSGSEDGLATPDDIDASRPDLPPDAMFVQVPGATHAFFGDYGPQPGDGTAGVDRAEGQAGIVAPGLALLDSLAER